MSLTYDYLKAKMIESDGIPRWLGKDCLEIGESLVNLVNGGINNFPPTQILTELTEPSLAPIKDIVLELLSLPDVSLASSLLTLETSYGINKAFNSKLRKGQSFTGYGNYLLNKSNNDDGNYYTYAVESWNETLNIPILNNEINTIQSQIGGIQSEVNNSIQNFNNKYGIDSIQNKITEIQNQIQSATGTLKSTLTNQLNRLKKFLKTLVGVQSSGLTTISILSPSFGGARGGVIVPITPIISPNLVDVVGVFNQLANWFLSMFSIPSGILEALTHAVTSVVCKAIGSAGADGCRWLAAGVLKSLPQLIPKVGSATGTLFGGAWALLSSYAPYIAFVAGLILIAIKWSKQTELGNVFYLFGIKPSGKIDSGFATVSGMNEPEKRQFLKGFVIELIQGGSGNYNNIFAVILDNKKQITLFQDYVDINNPIKLKEDENQEQLNQLRLYIEDFEENPF